jgi:hypothetical protein|tara:strand:+ start:3886 stop:4791 length:906 start_codon:yes stop_codon:yes gene_type:complete
MNKKRNRNRKSKRKFTATVSKPKNDIFSKWQGNTIPMLGYNYKIDKLKNDSKINTDVLYTQDYSKFKLMEDNRDVDDSHVAELVVSIRKRGQLQPIIINEKNEIIDGQRRFTSCKILGIPVMYLVSYKTTIKDVLLINTSQKSWNRHDYLKAYSHNNHWNHAEYRKISTFLKTYSLKFDIALFLLYGQPIQHSAGKGLKDFKMGDFKVENLEGAQRHANQLMKIKAFAPNLVDIGKFCKAFLKVSLIDDFSYVVAYKQLEKNTKKFDKCQNQEDWDEAMVKAYNFDLKRPNKRISIKKDGF